MSFPCLHAVDVLPVGGEGHAMQSPANCLTKRVLDIEDPVRIVVHEGHGHEAEAWVEDEWNPFYQPDDLRDAG